MLRPRPGPGSTGSPDARDRERTLQKLRTHLPRLTGLTLREGWTGLRTFAPDRRPVLGHDEELSGLWWAAGLGGFGVTCCLGVGEALAAWMSGSTVPWLHAEDVAPHRRPMQRWPIRPEGDIGSLRLVGW